MRRALLEDRQGDVNQLTLVLRKNVITCILLAIRHSVRFPSVTAPSPTWACLLFPGKR